MEDLVGARSEMTLRELRLLGGFEMTIDGQAVTEFESDTTRALLARIAAHPGEVISRPALAELLWPNRATGKALANLRHSLSVLRRAIGDHEAEHPMLAVSKTTVSVNGDHDVAVDVGEFWRLASTHSSTAGAVAAWRSATSLYRGPFLDGLDADIGHEWDNWVAVERAALQTQAAAMLRRLAELRERTGERRLALEHATAWTEVDRWDEAARRAVIRLLATDGRRNEALRYADRFVAELWDELDTPASAETRALIEDIRSEEFPPHAVGSAELGQEPERARSPCVGRDTELGWLDRRLDDALGGSGGVVFVSGPAGSGKSVLLEAFAGRAADRMHDLAVVRGTCNAYTGVGDPFLPFRHVLGQLSGDFDSEWTTGRLTRRDAARLWAGVPDVVEAVLDHAPHLIGALIDPAAILHRFETAFAGHPLTERLRTAVAVAERRMGEPVMGRQPLVEECSSLLARLSHNQPLLVLVDDLQWADSGTLDVILSLARRSESIPLLLVAATRPPGVVAESIDPVQFVVNEVGSASQSRCTLELGGTRAFVDECVDLEPNRLGAPFRDRLFEATGGHALFTVEMIGSLKQQGALTRDSHDRWILAEGASWDTVPPRVEATIATRLEELPIELRRDLEVAAVEGTLFSAEVVASARESDVADVVLRLSSLGFGAASLIEAHGVEGTPELRINRFRFRHALFRQYLYDNIAPAICRQLHGAIATAIEKISAGRHELADVALAHHFTEAGMVERAIEYRSIAARRSMALSSNISAISHLERALDLLSAMADSSERARTEVGVLTLLGSCHQAQSGYNAVQTTAVYDRLRALTADLGPSAETMQALGALVTVDGLTANYEAALGNASRLLTTAQQLDFTPIEAVAELQLGWLRLVCGQLDEADEHLRRAVELHDPDWDEWLTPTTGIHLLSNAQAWRSVALWHRGALDQASELGRESIRTAEAADLPFALVFSHSISGCLLAELQREPEVAIHSADAVAAIAEREEFPFYSAAADVHRGSALLMQGDGEGLELAKRGLQSWESMGSGAFATWARAQLAVLLSTDGRADEADAMLNEVDTRLAAGGDPIARLMLPLAKGLTCRARGNHEGAEAAYRNALAEANASGARTPELQAATELAALLAAQGRADEGREVLAPVLNWFTEGSDTFDLHRARELLNHM